MEGTHGEEAKEEMEAPTPPTTSTTTTPTAPLGLRRVRATTMPTTPTSSSSSSSLRVEAPKQNKEEKEEEKEATTTATTTPAGGGKQQQHQHGAESDTVWNLLWTSLWPASSASASTSSSARKRGGGMKNSMMLPRALKTVVTKLDNCNSRSWVSCIQLALWDNIFGPRLEQVWYNPESSVTEDDQITTARHSLSGELGEEEEVLNDRLDTKFHVFAEMGYIMPAVIFTGQMRGSVSKFSFCLLMPHCKLNRYLQVHRIIEDRLLNLVASLRSLMLRSKDAARILSKFSTLLPPFVADSEALFRSGLPPVDPYQTFLCRDLHTRFANFEMPFIYRAVTSHLITQCHTVVVGSDDQVVNSWVDSLSMFLSKRERQLSTRAREGARFVPNLYLQGLVSQEITDDEIIWNSVPLTIIDLDQRTIRQTVPLHKYIPIRQEYLAAFQIAATHSPPANWNPQDGLLRDYGEEWSGWVSKCLDAAWRLPPPVREGFVDMSVRILMRRAAVLIKYVDQEASKTTLLDMSVVQRIRAELGLDSEQDFLLVLSMAERFSPGIYNALVGDPAALEDKFIQLFESF